MPRKFRILRIGRFTVVAGAGNFADFKNQLNLQEKSIAPSIVYGKIPRERQEWNEVEIQNPPYRKVKKDG